MTCTANAARRTPNMAAVRAKLEGSKCTTSVRKGVKITLSTTAGTKTLIHELAHELIHQNGDRPQDKTILELEAEGVAYVVVRHFGIEGLSSPNYIALHGAGADKIMEHIDRIRDIASKFIQSIEDKDGVQF